MTLADEPRFRETIATESGVELDGVFKSFRRGNEEIVAIDDVSASFAPGTLTAITGVSGSGKSTLLNAIAGLVRPDAGRIVVNGQVVTDLSVEESARLRREHVFVIFQEFNLVQSLTVAENAGLTLLLNGRSYRDSVAAGQAALGRLDLLEAGDSMPQELSGGQRQRVAVARALAGHLATDRPGVVLADEPTGSLDSRTARQLFIQLRAVADTGALVLIATHDGVVTDYADRELKVVDGRVLSV